MVEEYEYSYINEIAGCQYAIYSTDNDPNEIAFHGMCFIYEKKDDYFNNNAYISTTLNNPSYLDLLKIADEQIKQTGDIHHIFF